jgi:hypothetical protein
MTTPTSRIRPAMTRAGPGLLPVLASGVAVPVEVRVVAALDGAALAVVLYGGPRLVTGLVVAGADSLGRAELAVDDLDGAGAGVVVDDVLLAVVVPSDGWDEEDVALDVGLVDGELAGTEALVDAAGNEHGALR